MYVYMHTYPYENLSLGGHFETIVAIRPANNAVQSKNMWKESDISPKLCGINNNVIIRLNNMNSVCSVQS